MSSVVGIKPHLYFDEVIDVSSDEEESSDCFTSANRTFPSVSTVTIISNDTNKIMSKLKKRRLRNKLAAQRWRSNRRTRLDELRREELIEEIKNDQYKIYIKRLEQASEEISYALEEILEEVKRRRRKDSKGSETLKLTERDVLVKNTGSFNRETEEERGFKPIIKEELSEKREGVLEFVESGQPYILSKKIEDEEIVKNMKKETNLEERKEMKSTLIDMHDYTQNSVHEDVLEEIEVVMVKSEKGLEEYMELECEPEEFEIEKEDIVDKPILEEEKVNSIRIEAGKEKCENLQYATETVQRNYSFEKSFLSADIIDISTDSESSNCSRPDDDHHPLSKTNGPTKIPVCLVKVKTMSEIDKRRLWNKEASQRWRERRKARLDKLKKEEMFEISKNKKYKTFIERLEHVLRTVDLVL